MLMRTLEGTQGRRGVIHHGSIGIPSINNVNTWDTDSVVALAPVIVSAPEIVAPRGVGRRGFLKALGIGVVAAAVPGMASAKVFTEKEMDSFDKQLRDRGLMQKDGGEETFLGEFNKESKPAEYKIKQYIDEIVARSKLGVHMQRHENVMWLIKYFDKMNKADPRITTDPRLFYYPKKVGANSKFVADLVEEGKKGRFKITKQTIVDPYINGYGRETKIYLKDGEIVEKSSKNRAYLAFIDTGWAYVILPKDTNIIISGNKSMIAACRNPIHALLSECP